MSKLTKEELEKALKIEGKVRGVVFQTDAEYVLNHFGEEGLRKLEKKVKELGYSIDYRHPKVMEWYPVGLRIISLLLIRDIFSLSDEDIKEMGSEAPKVSLIMKLLAKYFVSLKKTVSETSNYWREQYTVGELKGSLDMKKHEIIMRLEGVAIHPVFCKYLEGYIMRTGTFIIRSEKIDCVETKCIFKGAPYHEFVVHWQ